MGRTHHKNTQGRNISALFLPVKKHHTINQLGYNRSMEKHTPYCKLSIIKTLVENGKVSSTVSALKGAAGL
jgi:hypothetical protein